MHLIGATASAQPMLAEPLSMRVNYLLGNDRARWRSGLPTYGQVGYRSVYPGIDLIYYGREGELEYDFRVAPGADPRAIHMSYSGAGALRTDASGDLVLKTPAGEIRHHRPVIYQEIAGVIHTIAGRYRVHGSEAGFEVGRYDRRYPLIVDPVVTYASYFGGARADAGYGIGVDSAGNLYIGGETLSTDLNASAGYQNTNRGNTDLFVTKFDSKGTVVYTTYIGGNGIEYMAGLKVDSAGNVYVAGHTDSANFPTSDTATQTGNRGGSYLGTDVVFFKLDPTGSKLLFGTYLGGNDDDYATGIAIDSTGNAYITGFTGSTNFPTSLGAYQKGNKYINAFVTKYNLVGNRIEYSTLLGGNQVDAPYAITVDGSGFAYLAGSTSSTDFPTTAGAPQTTHHGGTATNYKTDAFALKLNANGSSLVWSTYLGGAGEESAAAIAVDTVGNAYLSGYTASSNFPVTAGALQSNLTGVNDAFIAKINAAGTALTFCTLLGGTRAEATAGIAVDATSNIYVAGTTSSTGFPMQAPFQGTFAGGSDAFVIELDPTGSKVLQSSYLGGSDVDEIYAMAMDANGNMYVTGDTVSTDLPVTAGAAQPKYAGGSDAFVARISFADSNLALTVAATALNFQGTTGSQIPHQSLRITGVTGISVPWKASATATGGTWLSINPASGSGTGSIDVAIDTTGLAAGTYTGKITVANQLTGTASNVDVTLALTKAPDPGGTIPPTGVVSAASFQGGAVAPGEMITIFGSGIGPAQLTPLTLGPDGNVSTTLADTQVLFDNIPAPLIYVSATQVSAMVPYGVSGKTSTAVQVVTKGLKSNTLTTPVSTCAPALFTADSSGKGQAAVINQDGSYNSHNNPADKGSILTLYATGEGQTDPAGVDGQLALAVYPKPILPVSAKIGGVDAPLAYFGAAPQMVAGMMQVNAKVPNDAPSGDQNIVLTVGSCSSPLGVTVAVK
jgi:uncharacterized protein (TIGR03437 family)